MSRKLNRTVVAYRRRPDKDIDNVLPIVVDNRRRFSPNVIQTSTIDLELKRVTATIPIPPGPHGMVITPDNITFIDTATREVIGSVPVGKPHNAIHPNGRVAYVGSQVPGRFSLAVIDLATRKLIENVPLEKTPRGLEFDPNGRRLYITQARIDSVVVVDPANNKAIAEIPVGVSPHYANFTPEGKRGLTAVQGPSLLAVFNPQTNVVEKSIKVGSRLHWVASDPEGSLRAL